MDIIDSAALQHDSRVNTHNLFNTSHNGVNQTHIRCVAYHPLILMNQQNKTDEQLKEEILTTLFNTGKIFGYYLGKFSKSRVNPLKRYIKLKLYRSFLLENSGIQANGFIDDIYSELFYHLSNIPTEKFLHLYHYGNGNGKSLIATALRIIVLKCFAQDKRNNNPKHSLVSHLGFSSVFNANNVRILPVENDAELNDEDKPDSEPPLILYDVEETSEFEQDYGFTIEELISYMTPEEKFVFEKLLGKQKPGAPSKERKEEKEKLSEAIRGIKENLQKQKGFRND
ncbi:MAG: hypothetical protein V4456_12580 [Bacteroidota bacterium]